MEKKMFRNLIFSKIQNFNINFFQFFNVHDTYILKHLSDTVLIQIFKKYIFKLRDKKNNELCTMRYSLLLGFK